jgi:dephospho-CoA kinase
MKVIGLTGNIASGKSTVARVWRSMGAVILDADRIAREVLQPGSEALERVVSEFGEEIRKNGELDRVKLAEIIFRETKAIRRLNQLVHPPVRLRIRARIEEENRFGTRVVVVDAALIFEAGVERDYDVVVVVNAPLEKRLAWLKDERGIDRESALRIEGAQMDPAEKARRGDYVLENRGDVSDLRSAASALFRRILRDVQKDVDVEK